LAAAVPASADTFTVTNGDDTTDPGTLRTAITDAEANTNAPTVDEIQFDPSVTAVDLTGGLPSITEPLTINGPGASSVNVRRSSGASSPFGLFSVSPSNSLYTVTIRGLKISGADSTGFTAGAVFKDGPGNLALDSVVITGNSGTQAAGLYYSLGHTTISNSTLTDNHALDVSDGNGGAILGASGQAQIVNSTIDGNSATRFGGGVFLGDPATIQILSSTITHNTADSDSNSTGSGGGLYNSSTIAFQVANTLLAGNLLGATSDGTTQCGGGAFTSSGYNLRSEGDTGCTGFGATGDFVNGTPLIAGAPATNGGPTPNVALLPGSPAIDAGNPAAFGAFPACPATDQRGLFRGGGAGRCDIGSYELNASTTPPPSGDGGTTTPPATTSTTTGQRAKAIKKCKKKFRKGQKRKKCIKRAKRLPV
jgi:hypothetical protein